jgi:vacuolar protein sorting-associated protein 35
MIAKANAELGIKLYLHTALAADNYAALCHQAEFGPITYELLSQGFILYEEEIGDTKQQSRNIKPMIGTLLACQSLTKAEYENFTPKAAQYSAKLLKKSDQCQMVALCAHLFYRTGEGVRISYAIFIAYLLAGVFLIMHRYPCNRM